MKAISQRVALDQVMLGVPNTAVWLLALNLMNSDLSSPTKSFNSSLFKEALGDGRLLQAWGANIGFWIPQNALSFHMIAANKMNKTQHFFFCSVCGLFYGVMLNALAYRQRLQVMAKGRGK